MDGELITRSEIAKRMFNKNISIYLVCEISGLPMDEAERIYKINQSYVGRYDNFLRKKYASLYNLFSVYYFKDKTKFATGVYMDKSDFYKNKIIRRDYPVTQASTLLNNSFLKKIQKMQEQYKNNLRFSIVKNADTEKVTEFYNSPDKINDFDENYELYLLVCQKIEKLEYEKVILELLSIPISIDKIALICGVEKDYVCEIKQKNSLFFKGDKLNLSKLESELSKWHYELKLEIAKRTKRSAPSDEIICAMLDFDMQTFEKIPRITYSSTSNDFKIRKSVLDKFKNLNYGVEDVVEITGIDYFHMEMIYIQSDIHFYTKFYGNSYLKHYSQHGDKELIWW